MEMKDITYRRAQNSDSDAIKHILKTTFKEYEINLPDGYSFADVENLKNWFQEIKMGLFLLFTTILGIAALLSSSLAYSFGFYSFSDLSSWLGWGGESGDTGGARFPWREQPL